VAELRKAGWSLRRLSVEAGLAEGTLKSALDRPYPKGENIIAAAIGVEPEAIWPSRYAKRHFKPVFPVIPSNAKASAKSVSALLRLLLSEW
jgi:Ner family transcriptional regulator